MTKFKIISHEIGPMLVSGQQESLAQRAQNLPTSYALGFTLGITFAYS